LPVLFCDAKGTDTRHTLHGSRRCDLLHRGHACNDLGVVAYNILIIKILISIFCHYMTKKVKKIKYKLKLFFIYDTNSYYFITSLIFETVHFSREIVNNHHFRLLCNQKLIYHTIL
jgi:hypothetical protein